MPFEISDDKYNQIISLLNNCKDYTPFLSLEKQINFHKSIQSIEELLKVPSDNSSTLRTFHQSQIPVLQCCGTPKNQSPKKSRIICEKCQTYWHKKCLVHPNLNTLQDKIPNCPLCLVEKKIISETKCSNCQSQFGIMQAKMSDPICIHCHHNNEFIQGINLFPRGSKTQSWKFFVQSLLRNSMILTEKTKEDQTHMLIQQISECITNLKVKNFQKKCKTSACFTTDPLSFSSLVIFLLKQIPTITYIFNDKTLILKDSTSRLLSILKIPQHMDTKVGLRKIPTVEIENIDYQIKKVDKFEEDDNSESSISETEIQKKEKPRSLKKRKIEAIREYSKTYLYREFSLSYNFKKLKLKLAFTSSSLSSSAFYEIQEKNRTDTLELLKKGRDQASSFFSKDYLPQDLFDFILQLTGLTEPTPHWLHKSIIE